jgi:hypothetical protein
MLVAGKQVSCRDIISARASASHSRLRLPTMPTFMSQLDSFPKKRFYAGERHPVGTLALSWLRKDPLLGESALDPSRTANKRR